MVEENINEASDKVGLPLWYVTVATILHKRIAENIQSSALEIKNKFAGDLVSNHMDGWEKLMSNLGLKGVNVTPCDSNLIVSDLTSAICDIANVVRNLSGIEVAVFAFSKDDKLHLASYTPTNGSLNDVRAVPINIFKLGEESRTAMVRKFVEVYSDQIGAAKPFWALTDIFLGTSTQDTLDLKTSEYIENISHEATIEAQEASKEMLLSTSKDKNILSNILEILGGK